jgi:hypothetical protein
MASLVLWVGNSCPLALGVFLLGMVLRSARDTFLRFFQTPSQPSLPAVDAAQPTFAIPAPPAASALQARRERRQTWCGPRKLSRVSFGGALVLNKVNASQDFTLGLLAVAPLAFGAW